MASRDLMPAVVRSLPLFDAAGFATALVDARSDHVGEDGLGGFSTASEHAADLGKVIADARARTSAASVWLIGTSRGSISAANAAARLSGPSAPDGLVLTQPDVDVCEGRAPHGFLGQEAEVAAGIARFIGGGNY